jgi:hypothetical protein
MIPSPRVRKPPPSPIRSVSGLLHKGKAKPRPRPPNLPLLPQKSEISACKIS